MARSSSSVVVAVAACLLLAVVGANADLASTADLKVLNYALTLEHLESAFYDAGLAKYNTVAQFTNVGYNASVLPYLQIVQAHEASHVAFLTTAINSASSGAAVPACTYNFTAALSTIQNFLLTAAALETGGQQAYDGAINGLSNSNYTQVAAQIATVEARHSAYLNEVIGGFPFPQAVDTAALPTAVATIISPYIISCPYDITAALPSIRPSGVALVANAVTATGVLTPPVYTAAQQTNDITALNYALTLEHFEAAFYVDALSKFTAADFLNAGLPLYYYNYTQMISGHETLHASSLTTVINGRVSGAAVPVCTYDFTSITTVAQYLATARVLELTGVRAYAGAANTITDTNLQQVAATIATVEARHSAFLNEANGISPFPDEQDMAQTPTQIIAAVLATGLLTACPYNVTGPIVIPYVTENLSSSSAGSTSARSSSGMTGSTGMTGRSSSSTGSSMMSSSTASLTGSSSSANGRAVASVGVSVLAAVAALYAIVA